MKPFFRQSNVKIWFKYKNTLKNISYVKKKKTEGFTFNTETGKEHKFGFAKLEFSNSDGMKKYASFFDNNEIKVPRIIINSTKFKLYESNLAPMLRHFHKVYFDQS